VGVFLCHKIPKWINLGAKSLIGDFKVKSQMGNQQKRIDSEIKSISAITLDPLDVPSPEGHGRLSQSKRYRMVPLSGTFTVESGGVFVPQLFKRHLFRR
jgi:hypothetical protein